jgi:hypothetical protein
LLNCQVGLSDYNMVVDVAVTSAALVPTVIKKHFTLRRTDGGVDSAFAIEAADIAELVVESERARRPLGAVAYGPSAAEEPLLVYRCSLYVHQDLEQGTSLTLQNERDSIRLWPDPEAAGQDPPDAGGAGDLSRYTCLLRSASSFTQGTLLRDQGADVC